VLALLYDVHGNLPALEAVLRDCSAAGATRYLLGGDYAAWGAWPRETVERLHSLDATWLRGNVDRWLVDDSDAPKAVAPALGLCRELLGEAHVHELAGLPESHADGDVLYVHGSPLSDIKSFLPEPSGADGELLAGARARRLVFGHTHIQFSREGPGGVELVNPGSVGMPFDGDHRAAYALVAADGTLELRRVDYDWRASVAAVRERLGEAGAAFADRMEQARFGS
jgi:predicted phosphodiesterase